MKNNKIYKFRLAGLSMEGPSTWHSSPIIKRLLYPSQPELYGPGGPAYEYLWFDKPIILEKRPSFSEMNDHLTATVLVRGNRIIENTTFRLDNEIFPTVVFEKHRAGYAPTIMKRYLIILNNRLITIGARLSHNNVECYSEEGYDEIVRSVRKI